MNNSNVAATQVRSPSQGVLLAIAALTAIALLAPWKNVLFGLAAAGALVGLLYLGASVLRGNAEPVLLTWVALFPLGYYYMSFPPDKPIINLDRIVILMLMVSGLTAVSAGMVRVPHKLKWAALVWAWFLAVASLSVLYVKTPLSAARLVVDAFLLPALLGWYILRHFNARAHLKTIHTLVCLVSLFCAAVGIAENVLQTDLMPIKSGAIVMAYDAHDLASPILIRANGPFSTNNSMALIGAISLILLLFLRRVIGGQFGFWSRMLHGFGVAAAVTQAMLPFFRSVIFTFCLLALIDMWFTRSNFSRLLRTGVLGTAVGLYVALRVLAPGLYEDRMQLNNFYGRVAQQAQTLQLFLDNPVLGVGLGNFSESVQTSKYLRTFGGEDAADTPHNNVGAIMTETGTLGVLPYVVAPILFLLALLDACRHSEIGAYAWKYLLYIFLIYWINGMAVTSGYFQDLNLWYLLATMLIYKVVITAPLVASDRTLVSA